MTSLSNTWNYKNTQGQWQQNSLEQNQYTYDNAGQRLTNQITSTGTSRTEQYSYDELKRLKTVDYGDGQTQSYSFDAMDNRLSKQDSITGTENYSYNAASMLLTRGIVSYMNDSNGNTLTGGGRTNTWNSQNRLVQCVNSANTSSFVYGSDGIRRQSTVNGITTDVVLDNTMFVRERNHATGTNLATYLVGVRGPEYRRDDTTGQVRWYLYDGLGSVLGEVDPNGSITSSRKYDVYGLVRGGTYPGGTSSHKFVGQLGHPSEDNNGMIYMRARYYDPTLGRFISQDSAGNGVNWFVYCENNPVNYLDDNGKNGNPILKGLLAALGAPFAMDLIGIILMGLGSKLDNPWLMIAGAIILIIGVVWTVSTLNAVATAVGTSYKNKVKRQEDETDAVDTLKEMGGSYAVAGWMVEIEFGLIEIDLE